MTQEVQGMLVQIEASTAQLRRELDSADKVVARTTQRIQRDLASADSAFDRSAQKAQQAGNLMRGAFAAIAGAGLIGGIIKQVDAVGQMSDRLRAATGSAAEYNLVQDRLLQTAKQTYRPLAEAQELYIRTADVIKSLGYNTQQTLDITDSFSYLLVTNAASADKASSALSSYSKSLQTGKIDQDGWNSIVAAMPTLVDALVTSTGKGAEEIRRLGITGKLSLEDLNKAFLNTVKANQDAAARMRASIGDALININTALGVYLGRAEDSAGAAGALADALGVVADNIDVVVAAGAGLAVAGITGRFYDMAKASGEASLAFAKEALAAKANAAAKLESATANAAATAAALEEARARAVNAEATHVEAVAHVELLKVRQNEIAFQAALAKGSADEARTSTALAAINLELAAAKKAVVAASGQQATTSKLVESAMAADAAATTVAAKAKQAYAVSSSIAARAGAAMVAAGKGVLAFLGGPVGVAMLAGSAAAAFLLLGDNADTASSKLPGLASNLDQVREAFHELGRAEREVELARLSKQIDEEKERALKIREELREEFATSLYGASGNRLPTADAEAALGRLGKAMAQSQQGVAVDWFEIAQSMQGVAGISQTLVEKALAMAAAQEESTRTSGELSERFRVLTQLTEENTASTNENNAAKGGMTAAGKTYLETLNKQLAGLQDNGDAIKIANRYIEENTSLNGDDAIAIRAAAAAIEAQKEANKKLTASRKEDLSEAQKAAKHLSEFLVTTDLAIKAATAQADAYLAGAESLRALNIQQEIEKELLKAGASARDKVTEAINRLRDAEDRRDIGKTIADTRQQTKDIEAQIAVILESVQSVEAGAEAQRAYNIEKQITAALAGKNAGALKNETAELRKQLGIHEDLREELEAHKKIAGLIDSTATAQEKLSRRMAELSDLMAHAKTPEQITAIQRAMKEAQNDASQWAKWTEGALDRVDSAFADAWRNIGDGFDSFRDSLTNAFKQMLAELAHMAITKPIIMQIGAMMGIGGGTQGNNGIWGSLLGGGSGGGAGGMNWGQMASYGQTLYSAATGWGPAAYAGFQSGGMGGALSGVGNFYGGMLGNAANTVGGWFGGQGAVQGGAGYMLDIATGEVVNTATQNGANAMLGKAGASAINPIMWGIAALLGSSSFYKAGYTLDHKQVADQKLSKIHFAMDPALSSVFDSMMKATEFASEKILQPIFGEKWGNILSLGPLFSGVSNTVNKALFGGAWQTKDYGLGLSIADGAFGAEQFEYRKKKGGLFSSSKKKTIWTELDEETATALQEAYDATEAGVASLFESLRLSVEEGTLAGLQLARQKISTKGKTEEEIQAAIAEWFGTAAEAMNTELNRVLGTGLEYDLAGMQAFVGNLQGVNALFEQLNYELYESTVAGGRMAEQLSALAGGFDALAANVSTYYDAFYTGAEKTANVVESITQAFEDAEVTLAGNRAEYRAMVDNIDRTTEAGREMFATLMALSGQAATYYSTLEQQLMGAASNAYASLQRSIANQQREIQQQASGAAASINALTGISNALDAALKRLRGTSDDTVRMLRAQAVMTLNSALVQARSGQSLAGFEGLQDALDVASQMDAALYSSLTDFEREQGRTANLIAELEKVNGKQLTVEQQMLRSLESQLSALDQQLLFAQAQLDALNGVDNSVLSIVDAVNAMNASVVAALSLMGGDTGKNATPGNVGTLVESVYRSVLGRDADAGGLAYWQNDVATGAIRLDQLEQAIKNAARENGELRGFAVGGYTGAGDKWDPAGIVHKGEVVWSQADIAKWGGVGTVEAMRKSGPELEVTGPSRIYSAGQTAAMLNGGGESAAEVRAMRRELAGVRDDLRQIAKNTMDTRSEVRQQTATMVILESEKQVVNG